MYGRVAAVHGPWQGRPFCDSLIYREWCHMLPSGHAKNRSIPSDQFMQARMRILARVERLRAGNAGDVKPVGAGVSEMRIDYGPGYRVYFANRGDVLIILLAGGNKRSQAADIKTALDLASKLKEIEK